QPTPSLLPYTTLFRSRPQREITFCHQHMRWISDVLRIDRTVLGIGGVTNSKTRIFGSRKAGGDTCKGRQLPNIVTVIIFCKRVRSEEHTSELQSRENL